MAKKKRRKRPTVAHRIRKRVAFLEAENAALKAKLENWGRPTKAEQQAKRLDGAHLTLPLA